MQSHHGEEATLALHAEEKVAILRRHLVEKEAR
jgi:hypothetical protein